MAKYRKKTEDVRFSDYDAVLGWFLPGGEFSFLGAPSACSASFRRLYLLFTVVLLYFARYLKSLKPTASLPSRRSALPAIEITTYRKAGFCDAMPRWFVWKSVSSTDIVR
ncbi:hypothetical protein [Chlorobaculum sp. 24CR]|uniref:hypothetical protein n=1 Tax=Chlorobaculum sp. 24CR TaxID=2508878 RepID=UPI001430B872|nr:hypothetical protein [Chlorobaculum sp. 24CR]